MTTENIRSGVRKLVWSLRSGMELRSMYVRTRFFATELCLSINRIWTRTAFHLRSVFSFNESEVHSYSSYCTLEHRTVLRVTFSWRQSQHGHRCWATFTHTSPSSRMLRFHNKLIFNTIWTFKQAFKKLVHCGSFWWPWFLVNLHLQVSSWWHLAANGSKLYLSLCTKPDGTYSDF